MCTKNFIKGKDAKCPILVSRLGVTEPNLGIGGSLWQASNPADQVVEVGLGVEVGYPLQRIGNVAHNERIQSREQLQDPLRHWRLHPRKPAPLK